jgi:hypothetical protein
MATGNPQELHGDGIMTDKHGADTDWMQEHGECLKSVEEGDIVHVIDDFHASTSRDAEYKIVDVPDMSYSFNAPAIQIVEVGTAGPRVTIAVGKVSKDAQR